MVVVMSRFRVINGMEADVERAFREPPHLVDAAPGFLGLETLVDDRDPRVFYLVTRWSDIESFRSWHGGAAHRESHKFIPRGLRLDPAYTAVWYMRKVSD
jgi:heme-degrading monooxygenase HmoA